MQLTNNFYYPGYIKKSTTTSVPKDLSCSKTSNNISAEEQKVAFKGAKTGTVPSIVASGMLLVNYPAIRLKDAGKEEKLSYITEELGISKKEFDSFIRESDSDLNDEVFLNMMSNADISAADFVSAVNDMTGGEKELFSDAFFELTKTVAVAKEIKNLPGVEAFALSLSELNDIRNNSADEKYMEFVKTFRNNDEETTNILESKNAFSIMQQSVRKASDNAVLSKIKNEHLINVNINGREKSIVFKDAPSFSPAEIKDDKTVECMIKSNLLTEKLCGICLENGINLNSNKSSKVKGPNNSDFDIKNINLNGLVDRVKKYGIENLSSHEIHALTDEFSTKYKDDEKFKNAVNKSVKNDVSAKKAYGLTKHLEKRAQSILQEKEFQNIKIDEHFFMRMIDRDLICGVKFEDTPCVLTFEDTLRTVLRSAKQGNDCVPELNDGNTSLITKKNGDILEIVTII